MTLLVTGCDENE